MLRFGASAPDMRELNHEDVFITRLKLLIIMSSTYLKKYPLGDYRKKAVIRNACLIAKEIINWQGRITNFRTACELNGDEDFDHIFFQRVKLLTVMAKAFAEEYPMGYHRLKAMDDNLNFICEAITFNRQICGKEFFKVA